jgi:hypothetical protein
VKVIAQPGPFHGFTPVVRLAFTKDEWPFGDGPVDLRVEGPIQVDVVFDRGSPAAGAPVLPAALAMKSEVCAGIKRIATEIMGLEV